MKNNPVGWFEIYVQNMPRAKKFYEAVLDAKLDALPNPGEGPTEMLSFPMDMSSAGAAGALVKMEGVTSGGGGIIIYFKCDDCNLHAGRVAANGGKVIKPKFSLGQYGFAALASDTEGNMFGMHSMK